jgi:hypothetical protein
MIKEHGIESIPLKSPYSDPKYVKGGTAPQHIFDRTLEAYIAEFTQCYSVDQLSVAGANGAFSELFRGALVNNRAAFADIINASMFNGGTATLRRFFKPELVVGKRV